MHKGSVKQRSVTFDLHGTSRMARKRKSLYAEAREIRKSLRPIETQQAVADKIGISRQAVEQIELAAIAKIARAFRKGTE